MLNAVWNCCVRSQYNARNESQLYLLIQLTGHDIRSSLTTLQSLCPTWAPIDYLYTELMGMFTEKYKYHRWGLCLDGNRILKWGIVFVSVTKMSWTSRCFESPVTRTFVQQLVQDNSKEYIRIAHYCILMRRIHRSPVDSIPLRERPVMPKALPTIWWLYISAPYTWFANYPCTAVVQPSPS